ncbi:hypothetical protein GOP47_0027199 [Adiantum capillus-veneris]|nr:hypothetical protein GOP47_0027199 [Adiantum capillus-veneris]
MGEENCGEWSLRDHLGTVPGRQGSGSQYEYCPWQALINGRRWPMEQATVEDCAQYATFRLLTCRQHSATVLSSSNNFHSNC